MQEPDPLMQEHRLIKQEPEPGSDNYDAEIGKLETRPESTSIQPDGDSVEDPVPLQLDVEGGRLKPVVGSPHEVEKEVFLCCNTASQMKAIPIS